MAKEAKAKAAARPKRGGVREVPYEEFLKAVESSEALAQSLREGDAVLIVNTPDGLAKRVVKGVRRCVPSSREASGLTESERAFLEGSELSLSEPPLKQDPMIWGEQEYARLVESSFRTDRVARELRVTEGRVRQRLMTERSLLGIRTGRGWFVPKYQFQGKKGALEVIPGLEKVAPRFDPDHHPVTVYRWLTRPNPDLETASENTLSPLDWLRSGRPPARVAELAAEL